MQYSECSQVLRYDMDGRGGVCMMVLLWELLGGWVCGVQYCAINLRFFVNLTRMSNLSCVFVT